MASTLFQKKKSALFSPSTEAQAATETPSFLASIFSSSSAPSTPVVNVPPTVVSSGSGAGSTIFSAKKSPVVPDLKMFPPEQVSDQDRADLLSSIIPTKLAAMGSKNEIIDAVLSEADRLSSSVGYKDINTYDENAPILKLWSPTGTETVKRGPVERTVRQAVSDIATGPVTAILKPFGAKGAVNTLDFPEVRLQRIEQFLTKYAPEELDNFNRRQEIQGRGKGAKMAGDVAEFALEAGAVAGNVRQLVSKIPVVARLAAQGGKSWYAAKVIENAAANISMHIDLGITKEQDKATVMKNIIADPSMLFPYARKWEMVAAPFATYLASRGVGMSKEQAFFNSLAGGVAGVTGYMSNQAELSIFNQKQNISHLTELATQKAEQIRLFSQSHPDDFEGLQKMQNDAIKDLEKEHRLIFKDAGKGGTPGIDRPAPLPEGTPQPDGATPSIFETGQKWQKLQTDQGDTVLTKHGLFYRAMTNDEFANAQKTGLFEQSAPEADGMPGRKYFSVDPEESKGLAGMTPGNVGGDDVLVRVKADALGDINTDPHVPSAGKNATSIFTTKPVATNATEFSVDGGKTWNPTGAVPPAEPPSGTAVAASPDSGDYLKQVKEAQTSARTSSQGNIFDRVGNFFKKVKSDLADSNAPVEDAIAKAEKTHGFEVLPKYDITNQIDRVLRSPTLANQFMQDHGLIDVIKNVDDPANLDQYLIAKQAQQVYEIKMEEWKNKVFEVSQADNVKLDKITGEPISGIRTINKVGEAPVYQDVVGASRTLEGDAALVRELGPKYVQAEQQVREYSSKLMEIMSTPVEKGGYGLISEETAAQLQEKYPDYVPLNRVFNETEQGTDFANPRSVGSLSEQTVVKRLKGSEREAESPLFSFLRKTYNTFSQGERNRAAYIISRYSEMPGMNELVRPLQQVGENKFEHAQFKISYLDNGVEKQFETTKEIAEAAKNLKAQQISILGKIFGQLPVRVFKVGTTGLNLPFMGANIVRDNVTAFVNSDEALATSIANPKVFVKSLMEAVGHGDTYDEFIRAGAGGTSWDIARDQPEMTMDEIRSGTSWSNRASFTVDHPIRTAQQMLRRTEDIFGRGEELTRLQQFIGTKQTLMDAGRTEEDATIEAAKAARENTANFFRKGNFGTVLNSTIPYFNAGIQGSRALIRSFSRAPIETTAKAAITVFMPMAVTTMWNISDPARKAAYADIQDWEKKSALIIVPPNPTKDERGRWNVIKIPLPPGLGDFASLIRRPIEAMAGMDPVKFMDVASAVIGGVSPLNIESPGKLMSGLTPQTLRPAVESVTNTNLFTGAPQVSDKLARLPAEQQVRPGTSGTVRIFSKPLGFSPIKVQAYLKGTFGGLADHLLNVSDNILSKFGYLNPDQVGGENVVKAMAARFSKAFGGGDRNDLYNSFQEILGQQDAERMQRKDAAELIIESLKGRAGFMQKVELKRLKKSNESLYGTVKDMMDMQTKGLTEEDRLVMQLGVANGFRAKYIQAKADSMNETDRQNYYSDLIDKKVITDDVKKQLGMKTGLFSGGKKKFKSSLFSR